jgi:hypothetical protein
MAMNEQELLAALERTRFWASDTPDPRLAAMYERAAQKIEEELARVEAAAKQQQAVATSQSMELVPSVPSPAAPVVAAPATFSLEFKGLPEAIAAVQGLQATLAGIATAISNRDLADLTAAVNAKDKDAGPGKAEELLAVVREFATSLVPATVAGEVKEFASAFVPDAVADAVADAVQPLQTAVDQFTQDVATNFEQANANVEQASARIAKVAADVERIAAEQRAPRSIVTDKSGRAVGVKTGKGVRKIIRDESGRPVGLEGEAS